MPLWQIFPSILWKHATSNVWTFSWSICASLPWSLTAKPLTTFWSRQDLAWASPCARASTEASAWVNSSGVFSRARGPPESLCHRNALRRKFQLREGTETSVLPLGYRSSSSRAYWNWIFLLIKSLSVCVTKSLSAPESPVKKFGLCACNLILERL